MVQNSAHNHFINPNRDPWERFYCSFRYAYCLNSSISYKAFMTSRYWGSR
jgi:hypothetical protein